MDVRPAAPSDLDAAHACYRRNGYSGRIRPADDALVAVAGGEIVGVVRLAYEQGEQILRGLFIDDGYRGSGLGTHMIRALAERMRPAPCWVICGPHLLRFYDRIGFRDVADAEAPAFLRERAMGYEATYGPQRVLRRPARLA